MTTDGESEGRRLGDELEAIREDMFVGRATELEAFDRRLDGSEPEVMFVHGPGGIGKTTLVRAFERRARRRGLRVAHLNGHELPPAREAIVGAVASSLGGRAGGVEQVTGLTARTPALIVLDGFESLVSMERFVGQVLEPALAPGSVLVAAGRTAPTPSAWKNGARPSRLDNLPREAALALMERQGVEPSMREAIYEATSGYPLALVLVLSLAPESAEDVQLEDNPDLVATLLERVIGELPTPVHRKALRLAAISESAPTDLLARIAGDRTDEVETWLSTLAFIEEGTAGLRIHDVVRECVVEDLRWRNPQEFHELRCIARDYYLERLRHPEGHQDQRAFVGIQHMLRHFEAGRAALEVMPDFFDLSISLPEPPEPGDWTLIEEAIERHEGSESLALWRHWRQRDSRTVVVRDHSGQAIGFGTNVWVDALDEADVARDPAVARLKRWLAEREWKHPVFFARFWMDFHAHQGASRTRPALYRWFTSESCRRRGPCATLSVQHRIGEAVSQAERWNVHEHFPGLDFEVGGQRYGIVGSLYEDDAFEQMVVRSAVSLTGDVGAPRTLPTRDRLAREVRRALRAVNRPDLLKGSPLLDTSLVPPNATPSDKARMLSDVLVDLCHCVRDTEDGEVLYTVLKHTYLEPAAKQLAAAMELEMSYATYRRRLQDGVERLVELVWEELTTRSP